MEKLLSFLNLVDIVFVVDATGSMGTFIADAKKRLMAVLNGLSVKNNLSMNVGLVTYRDHPPQDYSYVVRSTPLTDDRKKIEKAIMAIDAGGGGDWPEAVFDGINAAADPAMKWRRHSMRIVVLVGDASPHGLFDDETGASYRSRRRNDNTDGENSAIPYIDGDSQKCTCGLSLNAIAAAAEEAGIQIISLPVSEEQRVHMAFEVIARSTGGFIVKPSTANEETSRLIEDTLKTSFERLQEDTLVAQTIVKIYKASGEYASADALADKLSIPRVRVTEALARLGGRDLIFYERASIN